MPTFAQVSIDSSVLRFRELLVRQRAATAAGAAAASKACEWVRVVAPAELPMSHMIEIALPPLREAVSFPQSRGRGGRAGGPRGRGGVPDAAATFAVGSTPVYRFLVVTAEELAAIGGRTADFLGDAMRLFAGPEPAAVELLVTGRRSEALVAAATTAVLVAVDRCREGSVTQSQVPPVSLMWFDCDREAAQRVLHTALYFSANKDLKVRAEVGATSARKADDTDLHRLYTACLCEFPNVSERRARVVASVFPTMSRLLSAVRKDAVSFEQRLAAARDFGDARSTGMGLAAGIRAAAVSTYVPDSKDAAITEQQRAIANAFGHTTDDLSPIRPSRRGPSPSSSPSSTRSDDPEDAFLAPLDFCVTPPVSQAPPTQASSNDSFDQYGLSPGTKRPRPP